MTVNSKLMIMLLILFSSAFFEKINCQNWEKIPNIDSTNVFSIVNHEGTLYACTIDRIYKSHDGGESWSNTGGLPVESAINKLFSHNEFLYAGTDGDGVLRSSDGGENWQSFSNGLSGFAKRITDFTYLGDSIYIGTNGSGIFTINSVNPSSWSPFNEGLFQLGVSALSSVGENLIAGSGLWLQRRSRNASSWSVLSIDSLGYQRMIYDILPAGDDIFVGTNKGIYKGKLNGKPFMPADISVFPGRDIVAITIYKSRLLAGLYFKSEHWMFSSDNFGKSWEIQAHEFSSLWDLFVNGDRLWACRSDGLWYLDLDVWTDIGTPPTQPAEFKLSQNYPNPFNPTTTIKYSIPSSVGDENFRPLHMVTLKVYDILGSEAETLVNELKAPGNYKVEFDATNLAGGIYFYQLRAGNFSDVKKFILLK